MALREVIHCLSFESLITLDRTTVKVSKRVSRRMLDKQTEIDRGGGGNALPRSFVSSSTCCCYGRTRVLIFLFLPRRTCWTVTFAHAAVFLSFSRRYYDRMEKEERRNDSVRFSVCPGVINILHPRGIPPAHPCFLAVLYPYPRAISLPQHIK